MSKQEIDPTDLIAAYDVAASHYYAAVRHYCTAVLAPTWRESTSGI